MNKLFQKYDMQRIIDKMSEEAKSLSKEFRTKANALNRDQDAFNNFSKHVKLAIITIGTDMASKVYVKNKVKKCEEFGIEAKVYSFNDSYYIERSVESYGNYNGRPDTLDLNNANLRMYQDIVDTLVTLRMNKVPTIVQLPIDSKLLKEYQKKEIEVLVGNNVDVDCFHDANMGKMIRKNPYIMPCTVYGIMKVIEDYNNGSLDLRDKKVCVIGRSPIVGFPLLLQLIANNAKIAHINSTHKRKDLLEALDNADIVISAVGKHGVIDVDDIFSMALYHDKKVLVIDVGINRNEEGKLVGDFKLTEQDIEEIEDHHKHKDLKAKVIYTPVPGGIGKLTVLGVVINTFKLSIKNLGKKY